MSAAKRRFRIVLKGEFAQEFIFLPSKIHNTKQRNGFVALIYLLAVKVLALQLPALYKRLIEGLKQN